MDAVQSAHRGFQSGTEILVLLAAMAEFTGFYALKVNSDLTIAIPDRLARWRPSIANDESASATADG